MPSELLPERVLLAMILPGRDTLHMFNSIEWEMP